MLLLGELMEPLAETEPRTTPGEPLMDPLAEMEPRGPLLDSDVLFVVGDEPAM